MTGCWAHKSMALQTITRQTRYWLGMRKSRERRRQRKGKASTACWLCLVASRLADHPRYQRQRPRHLRDEQSQCLSPVDAAPWIHGPQGPLLPPRTSLAASEPAAHALPAAIVSIIMHAFLSIKSATNAGSVCHLSVLSAGAKQRHHQPGPDASNFIRIPLILRWSPCTP